MIKKIIKNKDGVAIFLMVVVIGAATLVLAVGAGKIGIDDLLNGFANTKGGDSFAVADGCVEDTLRRIRLDNDYGVGTGTITLNIGVNSCTIDVSDSGNDRTIVVESTVDEYHKKLQVDITISNNNSNFITINNWQELST